MSDAIKQYQLKCLTKHCKNECSLNKSKIQLKKATLNHSKISLNNTWEEISEENDLSDKQSALFSEDTSTETTEKLKTLQHHDKKFFKLKRRRRKNFKSNAYTRKIPSGFRKSSQIKAKKKTKRKKHFSKEERCLGLGKKFFILKKFSFERRADLPSKGKRGRIGGKAKGKPPSKEHRDKSESDEEYENGYYYRISLGLFQQLRNCDRGASTSNQTDAEFQISPSLSKEKNYRTEEESQLLELQQWGASGVCSLKTNQLTIELDRDKGEILNKVETEKNLGNIERMENTIKLDAEPH